MADKKDDNEAKGLIGWLVQVTFVTAPFVFLVQWLWPWAIPYTMGEHWIWNAEVIWEGVSNCWPLYVWGFALCSIGVLWRGSKIFHKVDDAEDDILIP